MLGGFDTDVSLFLDLAPSETARTLTRISVGPAPTTAVTTAVLNMSLRVREGLSVLERFIFTCQGKRTKESVKEG